MSLHWNTAVICTSKLRPTALSSVALIERRMRVLALNGDENAVVASVRFTQVRRLPRRRRRHAKAVQSWSLPLLRTEHLSLRLPE